MVKDTHSKVVLQLSDLTITPLANCVIISDQHCKSGLKLMFAGVLTLLPSDKTDQLTAAFMLNTEIYTGSCDQYRITLFY